jgi:hypothetical protein
VTFSDHASAAVELAVRNAALNGFVNATGKVFDWQQPPASFHYDLIIGSDLLYDTANHQSLLNTIQQMLKMMVPHGLANQAARMPSHLFNGLVRRAGRLKQLTNIFSQFAFHNACSFACIFCSHLRPTLVQWNAENRTGYCPNPSLLSQRRELVPRFADFCGFDTVPSLVRVSPSCRA